jgi:cation/acetate symporter
VFFSPVTSGKVDPATGESLSLFGLGTDFSWFPLENPGIVSIPIGFLFGYIGTVTSRDAAAEDRFDELEVRALTGAGSEKAVVH